MTDLIAAIQAIAEKKEFYGELPNANAQATTIAENCGDLSGMQLHVENGRIANIGYVNYGCGYSMAAHTLVCALAKGRSLAQARAIKAQQVADSAGGFPDHKFHYCEKAVGLLNKTIDFYEAQAGNGQLDKAAFDANREVKCGWKD